MSTGKVSAFVDIILVFQNIANCYYFIKNKGSMTLHYLLTKFYTVKKSLLSEKIILPSGPVWTPHLSVSEGSEHP